MSMGSMGGFSRGRPDAFVQDEKQQLREQFGNAQSEHRHFPLARLMRFGWYRDINGGWAFEGEDRRKWEVICPQCSDTDGPAAEHSREVQLLRGPYRKRKAKLVELAHFNNN